MALIQARTKEQLAQRICVMGAARSGIAAARFLRDAGASVFVSDICAPETLDALLAKNGLNGVEREGGGHTERILSCGLIVLSPGIVSDLPLLVTARSRGIPVWSEMELGYRCSRCSFVAITGSSGKSTTTSMLGSIVAASGRESAVAGNIGTPVIAVAPAMSDSGICVAEASSFQLETCDAFRPEVAAVLNLMKNHLDRYVDEQAYYNAKKRIVRRMDTTGTLVLNAGDELLRVWARELAGAVKIAWFGRRIEGSVSAWYEQGHIEVDRGHGIETVAQTAQMPVKGRHNFENASAAAVMALTAGVEPDAVARGLYTFNGLEHRLEAAGTFGGVSWYNDSKSTTAESVRVAVTAFEGGVHLIAGGRDKGCDFTVVNDVLASHVRQVILIGEAAERIERTWTGLVPITRASSLESAIEAAALVARPGESVVLSPGCSSFDMFRDYEDRGRQFISMVKNLVPVIAARRERG